MAGGGRLQKNKAHKTRFASKSSRREHKLSSDGAGGSKGHGNVKPGLNLQTAKELRLQRNKNIRDHKRAMVLSEKRVAKGDASAPRVLALIPLSSNTATESLKQRILSACSAGEVPCSEDSMETEHARTEGDGFSTVGVPRHKFRLTVIDAPGNDIQTCLQIAKVADIIAFVVSAEYEKCGSTWLSMLRAQGLPVTIGVVLGLSDVSLKKRSDVRKSVFTRLEAELPSDSKVFSGDDSSDCQQMLRHLSEHRRGSVQWRSQRPFVMAEQLDYIPSAQSPKSGTLLLSGYVREQRLSVNQLVHVSGVGDFQLGAIDLLNDPCPLRLKQGKPDAMFEDTEKTLRPDASQQEPLIVENDPDPLAGEQTWPTEEELAQAAKQNRKRRKRKLPKGTSSYQAAWIREETDGEDNDDEGENAGPDDMQCEDDSDVASVLSEEENRTSNWGEDPDTSDAMMDEMESLNPAQKKEELEKLKEAHRTDEEFPDEVDTPMDVPARERFAKYRGLKSLRTSSWDPKESLPPEYGRIFAFDNFNRTFKHVLKRARQVEAATVPVGSYVRLHIQGVPSTSAAEIVKGYKKCPVVACGLLQHESKMSILHFGVKKHESFADPIKSKDSLTFHTGFRCYTSRPIFSTDDINMNKHKYERFLHPGRFAVASVYAPILFPPSPLIVFKSGNDGRLNFVASGSLRGADPDRIILKKIVLSGYPLRVHKRKAVVRYMFHNPEDVRWFKPLEVWTKYGRRGRIMEPVGTHGAMKCIFDGVVQQRDAVCVSLYKRVYPNWPVKSDI